MTPRTWAAKKVEKYECGGCHGKVHADAVTDLLVKEHARSVRIVKAEIKRVRLDQHTLLTAGRGCDATRVDWDRVPCCGRTVVYVGCFYQVAQLE